MIKNNETEKLTPSEKTIIEKLISLLQELSFLINIYDTFAIPNGNKTFWIARINKPILIFPEINYQLPIGDYFIEKNNFQINIPTSITNETFRVAPIIFQSESKTYEEPFTLFTLIPRLKKDYNKHLLKPETIEKIEEIEKLLPKEKNTKEIIQKASSSYIQENFYMLAQNNSSNKLIKAMTRHLKGPSQLDLYGNGTTTEKDFKLFIKGYNELKNGVNQSAAMLLDSLMISATEKGLQDTLVRLPLRQYMQMRQLKDEKETRKQIKRDLNALERISFEYKGTGNNRKEWLTVHIYGGTIGQIKNGDIIFRFNQDFFDSFKAGIKNKYLFMFFPREALQGNIRTNPWKYWFARKISEHKRINIGKPNEDIISVKTLIEACPNFPTYEEVISSDRHINKRIIEPFERDMDTLNPTISWEYTDTEEGPTDYQTFIKSNIKIIWKNYPKTAKLISNKKKQKKGGSISQKRG